MNISIFRIRCLTVLIIGIAGITINQSWAATLSAASCSQANVSSAISSAAVGDTIQVPAGSCSWSGLSISKAVHLKGPGKTSTAITISGTINVTKQAAGVVRISDFNFSKTTSNWGFQIGGSWLGTEPIVFQNNNFVIQNGGGLMQIGVVGGLVVAGNSITAGWDDPVFQPKVNESTSWNTADTMGNRDTNGKKNLYFENNTIYGGTNTGIDCDDATRCVYRYNSLTYSSFNTHGMATSPVGVRHFEVYSNKFINDGGTSQMANQNWASWIRGGTGVIFNNEIANLSGSYWGDKAEIKLSIRGAEDIRPQGSCSNVKYPVPRQLGQNHNGTGYFTDPIYIWGNTGTVAIADGWNWGNPCGLNWSTFFQWGRDAVNGSPKPGYTPYTYPHPLTQAGSTTVTTGSTTSIQPPLNLRVQ